MTLRTTALVLAVIGIAGGTARGQGRIETARGRVTGHFPPARPAGPAAPAAPAKSNWYDNSFSGGGGEAGGKILVGGVIVAGIVATVPFWGPRWLLENNSEGTAALFPAHPYAGPDTGFLTYDSPAGNADKNLWDDGDYLKPWTARAAVEGGTNFDGLTRVGGEIVFDTASRFGLQTTWDGYHEAGDTATIGTVNLTYRFAQNEWAELHAGVGFTGWFDSQNFEYGANFRYAADVYLLRPITASTAVEVGSLGHAFHVHARGAIGVVYRRFEGFTGYDFRRVSTANLAGPFVGVRVWF